MAEEGPSALTVQKIAQRVGATTGSVYHRFATLDWIAAAAWITAAEDFQREFARALEETDLYCRVVAGALVTPRWSRARLTEARVLLRFDARDLDAAPLPPEWRARLLGLRRDLRGIFIDLAARFPRGGRALQLQLLQFLLVDLPLAATKPHLLSGRAPPPHVDAFIEKSIQGFAGEMK
jgi:AcrR family transcriptional regulator